MSIIAFTFGVLMGGISILFGRIDLATFYVLFAILYDIETIERRSKPQ